MNFVRLVPFSLSSPRLQEKSGRRKMVLVAVEAVPLGSWPPAVNGSIRTFTSGRCDFGASAPLLTKASLTCFSRPKEVQLFCQSWSNSSGRHQPSSEKSHLRYNLFGLLQWRPPCACKSSCQFLRLPPWQDVNAELHAQGLLSADLCSSWDILALVHTWYYLSQALSRVSVTIRRISSIVIPSNPDVS